jgi:hypothetical protein
MNRFDLEQAITSLWNLSDDINLICESLGKEGYNEDKILNSLIGISELNDMRVQRVMDIFEELVHNNVFKDEFEDEFQNEEKIPEKKIKHCKIKAGCKT